MATTKTIFNPTRKTSNFEGMCYTRIEIHRHLQEILYDPQTLQYLAEAGKDLAIGTVGGVTANGIWKLRAFLKGRKKPKTTKSQSKKRNANHRGKRRFF